MEVSGAIGRISVHRDMKALVKILPQCPFVYYKSLII
jgi:hypothetical protein